VSCPDPALCSRFFGPRVLSIKHYTLGDFCGM
jgi:hypothetical protein